MVSNTYPFAGLSVVVENLVGQHLAKRIVTMNELVDVIIIIPSKNLATEPNLLPPQDLRGSNADMPLARKIPGLGHQMSIENGLTLSCDWMTQQVTRDLGAHHEIFAINLKSGLD